MNTCKTCRHWLEGQRVGSCTSGKIESLTDPIIDWECEFNTDGIAVVGLRKSDRIFTGKDFGCVHWQRHPDALIVKLQPKESEAGEVAVTWWGTPTPADIEAVGKMVLNGPDLAIGRPPKSDALADEISSTPCLYCKGTGLDPSPPKPPTKIGCPSCRGYGRIYRKPSGF